MAPSSIAFHHSHPNYPNYALKMQTKKVHFTVTFEGLAGYPTETGCCVNSPPIKVQDTRWRLRLFPGGVDNTNFRHMSLYLVSENYGNLKASFNLSLVTITGSKEFTKSVDTVNFDYRPDIRKYSGSHNDMNCFGVRNYIIRSEAIEPQRRYCIDTSGTIIVCVDIVLFEGFENEGFAIPEPSVKNKKESIMEHIKVALEENTMTDLEIYVDRDDRSLQSQNAKTEEDDLTTQEEVPEDAQLQKRRKTTAQMNLLHAHKFILCLRSDVFRTMFDSHMQEANSNSITISNFSVDVVREMLYFLYTDTCHVELLPDLSHTLLGIACKYHIEGLKQICEHYLCSILTVSNAVELLELSDMYEAKVLKMKALKYVANNLKIIILYHANNGSLLNGDNRATPTSLIASVNSSAFELLGFSLCQEVMMFLAGLHPIQQRDETTVNEPSNPRSRKQSVDLTVDETTNANNNTNHGIHLEL